MAQVAGLNMGEAVLPFAEMEEDWMRGRSRGQGEPGPFVQM